jgi:hypothetical protein
MCTVCVRVVQVRAVTTLPAHTACSVSAALSGRARRLASLGCDIVDSVHVRCESVKQQL